MFPRLYDPGNEMPEKPSETMSFEAALERLEGIVRQLETGEMPLEESVKVFEEGMRLRNFCQKRLDEVEKKLEVLLADGSRAPFEPPKSPEGEP
jgi:exodeoxyribonuclease VII small subunit